MTVIRQSVSFSIKDVANGAMISSLLAQKAQEARDKLIADQRAPSSYVTIVDGVRGADESSVRPDGYILYEFNLLGLAAAFAFSFAQAHSPVGKAGGAGTYRNSWIVLVDGRLWRNPLDTIPSGSTVAITNHTPYHRKIDTGAQRTIGFKVTEDIRQAVMKKFPTLKAERQFWNLPGGYILKGTHRPQSKRAGRAALAPRSDRTAGAKMTYPTVVITSRR